MQVSKTNHVAFWICTALVAFFMISGGLANIFLQESIAGFIELGYPAHFARILGVWKVLGGIAILAPRFPRLKEWAYAGMTFELTGAAITDAVAGDMSQPWSYVGHITAPLVIAAMALVSWALRPKNRMLDGAVAGGQMPREGAIPTRDTGARARQPHPAPPSLSWGSSAVFRWIVAARLRLGPVLAVSLFVAFVAGILGVMVGERDHGGGVARLRLGLGIARAPLDLLHRSIIRHWSTRF
jgi:uncharacterized membrane protein YphA (DoxX/SURF4 family)